MVLGSEASSPEWLRVGEREYYEKQLATLRTFEEVEKVCMPDEFDSDLEAFDDKELKQSESAMKISNYANIVLLVFKVNSCFLHIVEWDLATPPVDPFGPEKNGRCMLQSGPAPWRLQHPRLTRCWIYWPGVSSGSRIFP
jgi:hypothetical protein